MNIREKFGWAPGPKEHVGVIATVSQHTHKEGPVTATGKIGAIKRAEGEVLQVLVVEEESGKPLRVFKHKKGGKGPIEIK